VQTIDRDTERLETFSDGVFAFAATLLVVSLNVPSTFGQLAAELYGFVGFAITFTALVLLWAAHRHFFQRFGFYDWRIVALNSVLLFTVLFFVYPLKFMATLIVVYMLGIEQPGMTQPMLNELWELKALFMIFTAGFSAVFVSLSLMYALAAHEHAALALDEANLRNARFHRRHFAIFVVAGLIAFALSALGVGINRGWTGWMLLLLIPIGMLHRRLSAPRKAQVTPP
jgi:uncharacterized membrane protein